jgi:hypothetical protein
MVGCVPPAFAPPSDEKLPWDFARGDDSILPSTLSAGIPGRKMRLKLQFGSYGLLHGNTH